MFPEYKTRKGIPVDLKEFQDELISIWGNDLQVEVITGKHWGYIDCIKISTVSSLVTLVITFNGSAEWVAEFTFEK